MFTFLSNFILNSRFVRGLLQVGSFDNMIKEYEGGIFNGKPSRTMFNSAII